MAHTLTHNDVVRALTTLEPIWESLTVREQSWIVQFIVKKIDYDGATGRVTQIMNLRLLTPEIQEELLLGKRSCDDRTPIQLKSLQFIASVFSWRTQRKLWENRD